MSANNTSTVPTINKTKYDIPLLTPLNYNSWQRTVLRVLREIDADDIISGEEDVALPPMSIVTTKSGPLRLPILSPSRALQMSKSYIDHLTAPKDMWETLKTRVDTSATRSCRTALLQQFRSVRPKGTDEPITEYFCRLLHYRQQLPGTNYQISDNEFRTHTCTTIPDQFATTIEVLMGRTPEPSVEEMIAAIQQRATTAAIAKDISDPNGNFSTAMYASTNGSHRGGF